MSDSEENNSIIEDATFDFTMGDCDIAVSKLESLLSKVPGCFPALHALCEIHYSEKNY